MICEWLKLGLLPLWILVTLSAGISILGMSGVLFYWLYYNPTFETWQHKNNPKYPSPEKVRKEVLQTIQSVATATICPSLSLWLASQGIGNAYCGLKHGVGYELQNFAQIWIISDFFEFFYHWCGHYFDQGWIAHKHHHVFYNPTPFAVIADDFLDQFMRSTPLLWMPLIWEVNMDLLILQYVIFFYAYGLVLHTGFEFEHIVDAHHPIINTAFQHYFHHARSTKNKPYHCGFFFKIWDQKFGSVYPDEGDPDKCICVKCARARGERSRELYDKIVKPDYSVMLSRDFWTEGCRVEWGWVIGGKKQSAEVAAKME